ncbi:MAG: CoA-binding protein [Chloroflexi bacterium]|nr:CoA-binding protein [Chloroflexota bacterium]
MAEIDGFFAHKRYALVEIDPSTGGFGRAVYDCLVEGGREVILVMVAPTEGARQIAGAVYTSVAEAPGPLDGVVLNVEQDPDRMLREVQAAVGKGVPRIWIENRCEAHEAVEYAVAHGVEVVDNACSLLVLDPHHIHWFHRKVLDLVGKTPQVQHQAAD